jgi:hypothetical protein
VFGYKPVAALTALTAFCLLGLFHFSAMALQRGHGTDDRWCVKPGSGDIACRKEGNVSLPSATTGRRTVKLSPESVVRTESGGLAQVAFKRQALCEFGPLPTEIVTRYGGPSRLFLQETGNAICTIGRNTTEEVPFFCDQNLQCPAIVTTDGPFSLRMETDSAVTSSFSTEAGASLEGGEGRTVVMIICSGSYEIRVARENSNVVAAGGSSGVQRVRITLVETATGISLGVESAPDARVCSGKTISGQKDILNL